MVLNPALYTALKQRFGTVKVFNAGAQASWRVLRNEYGKFTVKFNQNGGGEQYAVCCPFCGDTKFRLTLGHTWGTVFPRTGEAYVGNSQCHNEDCQERFSEAFIRPLLNFMAGDGQLFAIVAAASAQEAPKLKVQMRMPIGCVPLDQLPPGHRALTFLARKYNGLSPGYLARNYGACFTAEKDELYRLAFERIIFPVYEGDELVGWQGRAIDPKVEKRWLLPPGFKKTLYGASWVPPSSVPIINEGITNAICCGPRGQAIFGKTLDEARAKLIGERWSTAIIATDPETFLPDPHSSNRVFAHEMKAQLDKYCKIPTYLIQWPEDAMKAAAVKMEYEARRVEARKAKVEIPKEDHTVPDAADYGIVAMKAILDQAPRIYGGLA